MSPTPTTELHNETLRYFLRVRRSNSWDLTTRIRGFACAADAQIVIDDLVATGHLKEVRAARYKADGKLILPAIYEVA